MAVHIKSVAESGITQVTRDEFMKQCRSGMAIFCQGKYDVSIGIEKFTGSPFSHVATVIYLGTAQRWGVLEATKEHGVHIGHLDYYLDRYDGDIVLTQTLNLTDMDTLRMLQAQFDLVDEGYDVTQEVSMVAHKLLRLFPIIEGKRELFCSGLYEAGRRETALPLKFAGPGMATPEDVWLDPSIAPLCALVKTRIGA